MCSLKKVMILDCAEVFKVEMTNCNHKNEKKNAHSHTHSHQNFVC